jgi:uncharacterized protein YuzE
MRITYDKEADAMYVYFRQGKLSQTVEMGKYVLADIDVRGNMLGLEILNASRYLAAAKNQLRISIGGKSVSLSTPSR